MQHSQTIEFRCFAHGGEEGRGKGREGEEGGIGVPSRMNRRESMRRRHGKYGSEGEILNVPGSRNVGLGLWCDSDPQALLMALILIELLSCWTTVHCRILFRGNGMRMEWQKGEGELSSSWPDCDCGLFCAYYTSCHVVSVGKRGGCASSILLLLMPPSSLPFSSLGFSASSALLVCYYGRLFFIAGSQQHKRID